MLISEEKRRQYSKYFSPPTLRQIWGEENKTVIILDDSEVGWTDLFIDLIFVGELIVIG